jgi:hypothetical protein
MSFIPCYNSIYQWDGQMPDYLEGVKPGDLVTAEIFDEACLVSSGCKRGFYSSDAAFFGLRSSELEGGLEEETEGQTYKYNWEDILNERNI